MERVFRRRLQRVAILVEVGTEQRHGGYLCKRIDKGRTETGQYIEVARACLDKTEQAGAIDTLATGEDGLQVVEVVDDEVQRLQLTVTTRIHEIHHADVIINNVVDDIGFRKFRRRFLKGGYNEISIQFQMFVFHNNLNVFI